MTKALYFVESLTRRIVIVSRLVNGAFSSQTLELSDDRLSQKGCFV